METHFKPPRFITCVKHDVEDGNLKEYEWEKDKIFAEESLQDDLLMLQNVFEGMIISSHVYPLIFEQKTNRKEISLRSLEFYEEVQNNHDLYNLMPDNEKLYFLIGLRDLYVASSRDLLSDKENKLLRTMVELIDKEGGGKSLIQKKIANLLVTPYPTYQNKVVKFIPCGESTSDADEYFIRNELGLILAFVDPGDLSYHNFENVINLDSLFKSTQSDNFALSNFKKHDEYEIYTFDIKDKSSVLLSLDKYGLYIPPFNKLSRGGQRFIFSSENLSHALTNCLKEGIPDKMLMNEKFQFVNWVFRYNKFKPQDSKFASHYDTPYHDPERKHYSKYTLILYLTSGTADPVLSIDNGKFNINSIDCGENISGIIFDQKYEHEGKSFISSDKVFLRSELVFEYKRKKEVVFNKAVSKQFNIACYMTKQSVFDHELEKYASESFDHSAKARLNISETTNKSFKLIYKRYKEAQFVTNGYDYWFKNNISLEDAAVCLILDYFNCTFESGDNFNKLTYNQTIELKVKDPQEILEFLDSKNNGNEENKNEEDITSQSAKNNTTFLSSIEKRLEEIEFNFKQAKKLYCCPGCSGYDFEPNNCRYVVSDFRRYFENQQNKMKKLFDQTCIQIFDHKVELNKEKIQVTDSHITFDISIPVINFAACWGSTTPAAYMKPEKKLIASYQSIPSIPFKTFENGYHLKIELFNNSFVRKKVEEISYLVDLLPSARQVDWRSEDWSDDPYRDWSKTPSEKSDRTLSDEDDHQLNEEELCLLG